MKAARSWPGFILWTRPRRKPLTATESVRSQRLPHAREDAAAAGPLPGGKDWRKILRSCLGQGDAGSCGISRACAARLRPMPARNIPLAREDRLSLQCANAALHSDVPAADARLNLDVRRFYVFPITKAKSSQPDLQWINDSESITTQPPLICFFGCHFLHSLCFQVSPHIMSRTQRHGPLSLVGWFSLR